MPFGCDVLLVTDTIKRGTADFISYLYLLTHIDSESCVCLNETGTPTNNRIVKRVNQANRYTSAVSLRVLETPLLAWCALNQTQLQAQWHVPQSNSLWEYTNFQTKRSIGDPSNLTPSSSH